MGLMREVEILSRKAAGVVFGAVWLVALGTHFVAETLLDRAMRARVAHRSRAEQAGGAS